MLSLQSMLRSKTIRDFVWTSQDVKHMKTLLSKGTVDTLSSLCLYDSIFEGNSFALLMQLLSNVAGFRSLYLRMNHLSPKTLTTVGTSFGSKRLRTLSFWLTEPLNRPAADALVQVLQVPTKELCFTFAPKDFGVHDFYPFLHALQRNSNVLPAKLSVSVSICNHANLYKLVQDICKTNVVTHLAIDFKLNPDSAMLLTLSYLIQHATSLVELDFLAHGLPLRGVVMADAAVETFRRSLVENTTLSTLRIGHLGECPSIACKALIPALLVKKTLLKLQVFFNESEMQQFLQVLPNMEGLQRVETYWLCNQTSEWFAALENNETLHEVWLLNEDAMTLEERIKVRTLTWRNYLLTQARKYAQTEKKPEKVVEIVARLGKGNQDESLSSVYHIVRNLLVMDIASGRA